MTVPDPDPPKPQPTKPPPRPVVYFFRAGEFIKIGKSTSWRDRLASIQTGSAHTIVPLLVLPGSRRLERQLHIQFKQSHIRGEWFRPSDDLIRFIEANSGHCIAKGDT